MDLWKPHWFLLTFLHAYDLRDLKATFKMREDYWLFTVVQGQLGASMAAQQRKKSRRGMVISGAGDNAERMSGLPWCRLFLLSRATDEPQMEAPAALCLWAQGGGRHPGALCMFLRVGMQVKGDQRRGGVDLQLYFHIHAPFHLRAPLAIHAGGFSIVSWRDSQGASDH